MSYLLYIQIYESTVFPVEITRTWGPFQRVTSLSAPPSGRWQRDRFRNFPMSGFKEGTNSHPTPPPRSSLTLSAERRPRDTVEDLYVFGTIERAGPKPRGRRVVAL